MNITETRPDADLAHWLEADTIPEDKHYRMTGELPKASDEPAVTKDEKEVPEVQPTPDGAAPSEELEGETAAAPPAAPQQRETKSERRWKELSERVGAAEREKQALQRRLEELERRPAGETRETTASQPVLASTEIPKQPKPKLTDNDPKTGKPFESLDAWSDAVDQWSEARLESKLEARLGKADQTRQQAEQKRLSDEQLGAKFLSGKEKYPDFDQVAFRPDMDIPTGSPVDIFIRASENSADVLYHLGKNPEILKRFYQYVPGKDDRAGHLTGQWNQLIPPALQMVELAKIEASLAGSTPHQARTSTIPAKRITNAPRPPHEVNARSTSMVDPIEETLKANDGDGDFEAFKARSNARDVARRKGK